MNYASTGAAFGVLPPAPMERWMRVILGLILAMWSVTGASLKPSQRIEIGIREFGS